VAHDTDRVIAANVRALRAREGIRQVDLAERTGLSRPTIAALEKGSRRVTVADAIALCSALGVGVGALVHGDQDALRALGLDQTDAEAAQLWADALGDEGLAAIAVALRDARLPVAAAGRAVAVLRAAGRL
jgi:transcriptional regulator with XRE-family HTH domain